MDVIASDRALEFVRERGGELWVWLDVHKCCSGAASYLGASCEEPPPGPGRVPRRFQSLPLSEMTLHASLGVRRPPDQLHIDVRGRFRPRIEAYWNGCVFVDDRGPVDMSPGIARNSSSVE